jgi:hypothetical protein
VIARNTPIARTTSKTNPSDRAIPLSWAIVRFAVGWNLLVHAWISIMIGPMTRVPIFEKMGFKPGALYVWTTFLVELRLLDQGGRA